MCERGNERDLRIRITVQTQEINFWLGRTRRRSRHSRLLQSTFRIEGKTGAVGVLVGVEQDVRPIIFVVTDSLVPSSQSSGDGGNTLSGAPVRLQFEDVGPRAFGEIEWSHCVQIDM